MTPNDRRELTEVYAGLLLERISGNLTPDAPRTYGFEYEFLARQNPTEDCVRKMQACLAVMGFTRSGKYMDNRRGMRISFEPGGQIEYHSLPLPAGADAEFDATLTEIDTINEAIRRECGVDYLPVPYMPGRGEGPLCLTSERYVNLHRRLAASGARGHEMMKGTASIHLHARILTTAEMPALFALMSRMAESPAFRMGPDRRDVWDHTDPTRCGMPYQRIDAATTALDLCRDIVRVGVDAVVLGAEIPYWQTVNPSFESFLYHLTTLFTDVRLNMSAPTLELRTLDAMPGDAFREKWKRFIAQVETLRGAP